MTKKTGKSQDKSGKKADKEHKESPPEQEGLSVVQGQEVSDDSRNKSAEGWALQADRMAIHSPLVEKIMNEKRKRK